MNRKRRPVAFGTQGIKRSGRSGCRKSRRAEAEGSGDSDGWLRATGGGRRGRKKQIVPNKGLPLHRAQNWMSGPSSPTSHVLLTSQCTGCSCDLTEGSNRKQKNQGRTSSVQQLHSCVQPAAVLVKFEESYCASRAAWTLQTKPSSPPPGQRRKISARRHIQTSKAIHICACMLDMLQKVFHMGFSIAICVSIQSENDTGMQKLKF